MKYPVVFWDSGNTIFHSGGRHGGFGEYPAPADVKAGRAFRAEQSLKMFGHSAPDDMAAVINELEVDLISRHGAHYNLEMLAKELYAQLGIIRRDAEILLFADAICGPRYSAWLWDGVAEALAKLHKAGVYMGVIADTFLTARMMRRVMSAVGLGEYFGSVICSCDVGIMKPDRKIFETALAAVPTSAATSNPILYDGDNIIKDIEGANAYGWDAALHLTTQTTPQSQAVLSFSDYNDLVLMVLD